MHGGPPIFDHTRKEPGQSTERLCSSNQRYMESRSSLKTVWWGESAKPGSAKPSCYYGYCSSRCSSSRAKAPSEAESERCMRGCHCLKEGRMGETERGGGMGVCCYTEALAEDLRQPIRARPFITYNIKHTTPFFSAGRCITRGWCCTGQSVAIENRLKM